MSSAAAFAELCPSCFTSKGNAGICSRCGYDEGLKRGPLVLPHRTLLHHGQYLIGKVLGKPGGFGVTYLALDIKLETKVAIKEYLPRDLAGRDAGHHTVSPHSEEDGEFFRYGLTQFLQEARTLAQFDHANIVRVRNFFEENGTGYLVMDYYDGITLADYLAQQPQGRLPVKTAVGILMPILDGLREVHAKNFLHRDIKPQNIYLTTANRPILLDFGAARQAMGERSRSLSVVLSEGYAPYEQYHRRGEQGPWTDIYACAAVLYHAVAGEAPPPATERVHKDELDIAALGVSASLAEALRLGLATDHHNRPQRMTEFQALLLGGMGSTREEEGEQKPKMTALSAPAEVVAPRPIEPTKSKSQPSLQVWGAPVLAVAIVMAMVAVGTSEEKRTVPTPDAPEPVVPNAEMKPLTVADDQKGGGGSVTYKTEQFERDGDRLLLTRLVATLDGKRLQVTLNYDQYLSIDAQKDFNGDGVMDALITTHNQGSGGIHETMFINVAGGKIVVAPVNLHSFKIVEEGGRFLVKSESDDATEYWGFDGKNAVKVRSVPHRKIETIAEIRGEDETLDADLDSDGKPDRITCNFWRKEQVYTSCTLPLPGGKTQDIRFTNANCNRLGVLKTQSNSYRELVCNNNAVIRFDGKAWVLLKPAP